VRALAVLLVAEAMFFFAIPTLSSPRGGSVDMPAIAFLRENLGLQRFYTLGPIAPNYGAYFGIASINHNYLPVASRWADWFKAHLDPGNDNPVVFSGARFDGDTNATLQLRAHLATYEWAGVKYVVAPGADNPFDYAQASAYEQAAQKVYGDDVMSIYELPDPRPYFQAVAGGCTVEARERTRAVASCAAPGMLVRRELFFPGWTATVNGTPAPIRELEGLFQAIDLPQGKSEVRYSYELAGAGWAWLAVILAFITLGISPARRP
jgi:hypothetical protein